MSREIRRVPADWEHPREPCRYVNCRSDDSRFPMRSAWPGSDHYEPGTQCPGHHFKPLYDQDWQTACEDYDAYLRAWYTGGDLSPWYGNDSDRSRSWSWHFSSGPEEDPQASAYRLRTWTPEEATHFQMYETVSDGTPVSPIFESLEDLKDWLVATGHSPAAAARFVEVGYAPSMIVQRNGSIIKTKMGIEGLV